MWKLFNATRTVMQSNSNSIKSSLFTEDVVHPQTKWKYIMHIVMTYYGAAGCYGYIETRSKMCDDPKFSNRNYAMNVHAFYGGLRNMAYMTVYPVVGPLNYISYRVRKHNEA